LAEDTVEEGIIELERQVDLVVAVAQTLLALAILLVQVHQDKDMLVQMAQI
jgi:hypothetical protein